MGSAHTPTMPPFLRFDPAASKTASGPARAYSGLGLRAEQASHQLTSTSRAAADNAATEQKCSLWTELCRRTNRAFVQVQDVNA